MASDRSRSSESNSRLTDTGITKCLMEDLNLDQSDFECGSENDDEEISLISLPRTSMTPVGLGSMMQDLSNEDDSDSDRDYNLDLISTSMTPVGLPSLIQDWSDDNDPDYEPDIGKDSIDSTDEEQKPSTKKRKPPVKRKKPQPKGQLKDKAKKVNLGPSWREARFSPEPITLSQPSYYEEDCSGWDADDFLKQYIDDDIVQLIVDKSNQTYFYKTNKLLRLSVKEMKVWLGITFVMSALQYPIMRMYWEKKYKVSLIADAMTRDRYFFIRGSLKVVFDNEVSDEMRRSDRLWKVRPVLDKILAGCMKQPRNQEICVDEMMIPFSGRCNMKQYMPDKPNPVGLKVFVFKP